MTVRVVLCNCSPEEAPALARRLVEERLAACVNQIPGVVSVYRWDGEVCEEVEVTLLIKTTAEGFPRLARRLTELHSYDVPEIVGLDSAEVSRAYAEWVHDSIH
jgi:periplasmic divalent cation tolerance protein